MSCPAPVGETELRYGAAIMLAARHRETLVSDIETMLAKHEGIVLRNSPISLD